MKITAETFAPSLSLSLSERRINVDPETRRIAVRVASWNDAHSGFAGSVKMPRDVNVEAAHAGTALLEDGSSVPVANLPMGTLHAAGGLSAEEARRVYEDTGRQVARVRYSLDDEGIRADGILYDDVDQPTLDRLVASAPSGDWRTMTHIRSMDEYQNAKADFVGAAIVNIPGFSGTFTQSAATPLRLVASGSDSLVLVEALTAASIGSDGVSDEDIRRAWSEANPREDAEGDCVGPDSWVLEFYAVPQKIIAEVGGDEGVVEVSWDVNENAEIVFGERIPVEKVWIPLTAAAGETEKPECEGETPCDGCTCGKAKPAEDPAYSLTASGSTLEELQAAVTEQMTALTADASGDAHYALNEETYRVLVERVDLLEEIIRDAILSM